MHTTVYAFVINGCGVLVRLRRDGGDEDKDLQTIAFTVAAVVAEQSEGAPLGRIEKALDLEYHPGRTLRKLLLLSHKRWPGLRLSGLCRLEE